MEGAQSSRLQGASHDQNPTSFLAPPARDTFAHRRRIARSAARPSLPRGALRGRHRRGCHARRSSRSAPVRSCSAPPAPAARADRAPGHASPPAARRRTGSLLSRTRARDRIAPSCWRMRRWGPRTLPTVPSRRTAGATPESIPARATRRTRAIPRTEAVAQRNVFLVAKRILLVTRNPLLVTKRKFLVAKRRELSSSRGTRSSRRGKSPPALRTASRS